MAFPCKRQERLCEFVCVKINKSSFIQYKFSLFTRLHFLAILYIIISILMKLISGFINQVFRCKLFHQKQNAERKWFQYMNMCYHHYMLMQPFIFFFYIILFLTPLALSQKWIASYYFSPPCRKSIPKSSTNTWYLSKDAKYFTSSKAVSLLQNF